ncbi:hypothetical protein F5146DRAFT_1076655 [Armillaria mellea]|nr:hypothetical protein F5146DRAFT_1076655 [Armillaria mellea]
MSSPAITSKSLIHPWFIRLCCKPITIVSSAGSYQQEEGGLSGGEARAQTYKMFSCRPKINWQKVYVFWNSCSDATSTMQFSLFILTAATLILASPNATPIVEKRCIDSSDLVECCQEIGTTNTTLCATQGIDAPVDTSRMVGYNCSLPTIEIAGQTSQCKDPNVNQMCCSHQVFYASDGTYTAVNCTEAVY